MQVAILDDYQGVALACADWTEVEARAQITIFQDYVANENVLAARLAPFEILCVMRERTSLPASLLERLPRLRLIASTGPINASIDLNAARRLGIEVAHTRYDTTSTVEFTWALILASQRGIVDEIVSVRSGGWQCRLGRELRGRTLGLLGLGRIGAEVARIGAAFGMRPIAWSQNLSVERAAKAGAELVSKAELFRQADVLTIHTLLSRRTRGLVDAEALAAMKPDAWLVNTSRGPIVDQPSLLKALQARSFGGYAVDVYDEEPVGQDHPFRTLPCVLPTPHIGYVAVDLYRIFYTDSARTIASWLMRNSG